MFSQNTQTSSKNSLTEHGRKDKSFWRENVFTTKHWSKHVQEVRWRSVYIILFTEQRLTETGKRRRRTVARTWRTGSQSGNTNGSQDNGKEYSPASRPPLMEKPKPWPDLESLRMLSSRKPGPGQLINPDNSTCRHTHIRQIWEAAPKSIAVHFVKLYVPLHLQDTCKRFFNPAAFYIKSSSSKLLQIDDLSFVLEQYGPLKMFKLLAKC